MFGYRGCQSGDNRPAVFMLTEFQRDCRSDHDVLPFDRDRKASHPVLPVSRSLVKHPRDFLLEIPHERLVGSKEEVHRTLEAERPAVQKALDWCVARQSHRLRINEKANMVRAPRRVGPRRAPITCRREIDADAGPRMRTCLSAFA